MLEVRRIGVSYGPFKVLWDVSIRVDEKEIVALIGPNGAGKTTTLITIAGLKHPDSGEILYNEERIDHLESSERVERGIALVPEGKRLFPYMTVRENLILGAYTKHARKKMKDRLEYVFTIFPRLKERKDQLALTLSGGEQQMLAIGRALMSIPHLLMLDEPSQGLAPTLVDIIFKVIEHIREEEKVSILLVEQHVTEALEISDRAYVLETGRIVLHGASRELLQDERIVRTYLGLQR
jgi:branched-chain amino acid transport system ATP-binding protein